MATITVRIDYINIFDGKKGRCRLDKCKAVFDFDDSALIVIAQTDDSGSLEQGGHDVAQKYNGCLISFRRLGYKTIEARCTIEWTDGSGDDSQGVIKIGSVYMEKM